MKIYVVVDGDYLDRAFKTRADAEEYLLHEAYLAACRVYNYYEYDWDQIKYRFNHYNHCFKHLGAYAMHRETVNVFIEEIELED